MSKTACRVLKYLLPGHSREEVMTNFEQLYEIMIAEKGTVYAKYWIWLQIIGSIPGFISASLYWKYTMFRSYMKIAYRNLLRNRVYTFINIFGLAVGMACCIVIFLFVQHEFSYDNFHENADRIYRLNSERIHPTGVVWYSEYINGLNLNAFTEEIPELIKTVRYSIKGNMLSYGGLRSMETLWYYDPEFFEIFRFPLVTGDAKTALNDPNNIVISEKAANKYFGDKNPVGEIFRVDDKFDFRITGVMKNIPDNSSFKADFIASYISLKSIEGIKYFNKSCGYYFLLSEDASIDDIENKFYDYYLSNNTDKMSKVTEFYLEPLKSIHLSPFNARGGDKKIIYIYSTIAIIVMLIACINFINLSTAGAMRRSREVGMRKVMGADRNQLMRQFLSESVLLSFLALFIAITVAYFILPYFNVFTGKNLSLFMFSNTLLLLALGIIVLFVGIFSGFYPAVLLSSFKPIDALKGKLRLKSFMGDIFGKGLVIFQYAISLIFIFAVIVASNQLGFIRNKDLGFETDNILRIQSVAGAHFEEDYELLENKFLKNPDITDVTASFMIPGVTNGLEFVFNLEGFSDDESFNISLIWINYNFFDFYGIDVIEGRGFSKEISADITGSLILNETAVKQIGLDSPIGRRIFNKEWKIDAKIIGVVKDFHQSSLHEEIVPTVFQYKPDLNYEISLRIRSNNIPETISYIKDIFHEFYPDFTFNYYFIDEEIAAKYIEDYKLNRVFQFSSILAIIIACLGIFGLASFTAEQRVKEIGIRKVLGSTVPGILALLSRSFIKLALLAIIIASPIAYYIMNRWLTNFAYRINIRLWMFVLSAFLILIITMLSISYQSIKAATANPVDTLRHE